MVINVKTDKERYFNQLLALLGAFPPFNVLTDREREVFGYLLLAYNSAKGDEVVRFETTFSIISKETIRMKLGISKFNLNNLLNGLRKKGFVSFNYIHKQYILRPDKELTFKFIN